MISEEQLARLIAEKVAQELLTFRRCEECVRNRDRRLPENLIPIGVSARHMHISQEDLEILFGKGYQLRKERDLYQPGEFASAEVVQVVGPRGALRVRILGPTRKQTQVEISRTDCVTIGVDAPYKYPGDLKGAAPITIVGPKGAIYKEAAIIQARHIHTPPDVAARMGIKDGDLVSVKVAGERGVIFTNVLVRVSEKYLLQMHLDTDDANAAGVNCNNLAELVK
ncbi:MAG: phosphate propanoyltransferase [Candidatus Bathyarchaeia archaeon]